MCVLNSPSILESPRGRQVSSVASPLPSLIPLAQLTSPPLSFHSTARNSNTLLCFALCSRTLFHHPLHCIFSFPCPPQFPAALPMPHRQAGKLLLAILYNILLILLYFAAFNGCRCTHCCTAFPRSPRFLIILLK